MTTTVRRLCVFALISGLSLALAGSAPAAADPLKIIALQYRLFDDAGRQRGGVIAVGDPAAVYVGETVRLELVGSAIIGSAGREVPIEARFEVAAGKGAIDIVRVGRSWVDVAVRGGSGNGLAQVGFTVTGNYEMRGRNTFGRLTLEVHDGGTGRPVAGSDSGWDASSNAGIRELTETLYRSILNSPATGREAQIDFQSIRSGGQQGALAVAISLARDADQQGFGRSQRDRGYQDEDMRRTAGLYQSLLRRQQSAEELWSLDRGFVNNVRLLHERGLVPLVETIVGSEEFAHAWGFGR